MKDGAGLSLSQVVEAYEGRLTSSDRSILSTILSDPSGSVYLSAAQLADKAEVHASTVVRLAHKLGFEGYPELRAQIRNDAMPSRPLAPRSRQRMDSIEQGSNLATLIESEVAALEAVQKSVSQQQIDQAAEILARSGTAFLVGRGSAAPLVTHLDRRLRRIGFGTSVAMNLQRRDLAERLMGLSKGDVVVLFAFQAPESVPAGYSGLIRHAERIGARSIVISDSSGPTLRPRAEVTLSVNRPDAGVMQLRTGPMVICEALAMTLAHLNPERAIDGLEALEGLRRDLLNNED